MPANGSSVVLGAIGRFALACCCFFSPWATFLPLGYDLTPVIVGTFVATLAAMVAALGPERFALTRNDVRLFAFLAVLAVSGWLSAEPEISMFYLYWWTVALAGYFAVRVLIRTEQHLLGLVVASLAGATYAGLNLEQHIDEWGNASRFMVFANNPNFTAYVLAGTLFIFTLWVKARHRGRVIRSMTPPVIGFLIYLIYKLDTQGALISALATVFMAFFGARMSSAATKAFVAFIAVLGVLLSIGLLDFLNAWGNGFSARDYGGFEARLDIWPQARAMIAENPLLGLGPGQYQFVTLREGGAHNFFLTVGLDSGIIGFSLIGVFVLGFAQATMHGSYGASRLNLLALFSAYWFPIALTGHWEAVPFSWIVVAVALQAAQFDRAPAKVRAS